MPRITKLVARRSGAWTEVFAAGMNSIRLPLEELPADTILGTDISEDQWQQLASVSRYFLLRDTALRMLGRRDHFEAELRRKLRQRELEENIVERVIEYCRKREYLDDNKALMQAIERLQDRGPIGEARVRAELYKLGCPADLIPRGIEIFNSGVDTDAELQRAISMKRRHFAAKLQNLQAKAARTSAKQPAGRRAIRYKLMAAAYSYLSGRGFSPEQCSTGATGLVEDLLNEK